MPNRPAMAFLRSFRSDGMPSQRGPRFPRRLKDRPDCSACRDGTPSPSRLRACRAIARYLDWRSETDMTDGNRPQSLRPNTKILRLRTDHARQHAPSEDRQRLPSCPISDRGPARVTRVRSKLVYGRLWSRSDGLYETKLGERRYAVIEANFLGDL